MWCGYSRRAATMSYTKDIDFSPEGIRFRWEAGYAETARALERQAWIGEFGLLEGVILHEPEPGAEPAAEIQPGEPGGDPNPMPRKLRSEEHTSELQSL